MPHSCSTLTIHCIDFRFGAAIKRYLEEKGLLGDCGLVAVAGAAKTIASPERSTDREFLLRQIDISVRLHGIQAVLLINHTDCGGYGGRTAFASPAEEYAAHAADMASAATIIKEKYPVLAVRKVLARIDSEGQIVFEDIP